MKRVILYTRVSTQEQSMGNSLQYQKTILENHCKNNNYEIVKSYEQDHSAKNFNRPKWIELSDYCKRNMNGVDTIIFSRWDRFSVNLEEAIAQIRHFKKLGIEVNSVENPLDMSNPDNKILLSLYLMLPEIEKENGL